jgi:hypothetical protein
MTTIAIPYARKATPKNSDPCIYCGEPVLFSATSAGRGKMAHRACRLANPASRREVACAHCESLFTSAKRSDGRWTKTCSKSCARKLEISKGEHSWGGHINTPLDPAERAARAFERGENARRKRRARLAGVKREPYTTASIAERDGYLCSLCGERVDVDLKYPHPGSASVDHILPLSLGGDDTLANVALACLCCNLRKSNRV